MKVFVIVAIAALACKANAISTYKDTDSGIQDPGAVCDDCMIMVQDIKNLIQSEQSKNTTTAAILYLVCGELSTDAYYEICSKAVMSAVPKATQALADFIKPIETCIAVLLCPTPTPTPPPKGVDEVLKFHPAMASEIMKKDCAEKEKMIELI